MFRFRIILLFLFTCILTSCNNKEFSIGENWIDVNTKMTVVDTFTVNSSTVFIDSIVTSGKSTALIGIYNDPLYTGKIKASSFMEITRPAIEELSELETDAVFDSLVLYLAPQGTHFGDTLGIQKFKIYKTTTNLLSENYSLYNTTEITTLDGPPIASVSDVVYPNMANRKIEVRLPDGIGMELLDKFIEKSIDQESEDNFSYYFKAFAFIPDDNTAGIIGYNLVDSMSHVVLYYHLIKEQKQDKKLTFNVKFARQYNKIEADRSQTHLADLNGLDYEKSSAKTNDQSYLQTGVPLYVKLEFPTIDNLLQIGRFGKINKAILTICPIQGSYGGETPLPSQLNLIVSNDSDESVTYITDNLGMVQTGNLFVDHVFYENTRYQFDITRFLNTQLGVAKTDKFNLKLTIPLTEEGVTIQRLVVGSTGNGQAVNRMQLQIEYSSYNGRN